LQKITHMEASIIKIGNSQGLIIPKRMLNQLGAGIKMEIQVKDGGLFILPIHDNPRQGWEEAFAAEAKAGHKPEEDPFNGIENEFDREEWKW
jgi:antitoxin MazE